MNVDMNKVEIGKIADALSRICVFADIMYCGILIDYATELSDSLYSGKCTKQRAEDICGKMALQIMDLTNAKDSTMLGYVLDVYRNIWRIVWNDNEVVIAETIEVEMN